MASRPGTKLHVPLLFAGALAGMLLAASEMLETRAVNSGGLPDGVIARVGDTLIPMSRYDTVLTDLAADKRNPLSDADRKFVLDRLIEEELLVQRGIELGLASDSAEVRKALVSAVLRQAVADASTKATDEQALREFFAAAAGYFSTPGRYHVKWWTLDADGVSPPRSPEWMNADDVPGVWLERHGFEAVTHLPDTLLPRSALVNYIGPELMQRISRLRPAQFSEPLFADRAWHVLLLVQKQAASTPPFESIRDVVEREYEYRAGDMALRDYLAWLRGRTSVVTTEYGQ